MSTVRTTWARRRLWAFALVALGVTVCGDSRAETIGPYIIEATPTSAALVSGGGATFTWLNVVNTPVSLNEALTGFSIIADGYGNASAGTTLLLTFAAGALRNRPGPDLVLLDAGNDLNVYLVSTSHDNFAHQIVASAASDTGVDRSYFFGGQGPTTFDVMAGTVDLSSLNVPDDQTVSQVRLFTEGPSNDPLGLGVLARAGRVPPSLVVSKSLAASGDIVLDWAASCSVGAADYGIYEGTIGVWYDHSALDCTDDSLDTVEQVTPAAGNRYYLLVPHNAAYEGSYGVTSTGAERPVGVTQCAAIQDPSACP